MAFDRIVTMKVVRFERQQDGTSMKFIDSETRVWAEVVDGGSSEFLSGGTLRVEQRLQVTIRWSSLFADLPPTRLEVEVEGVEHNILTINDYPARRRLLTMQTIAEVAA